MTECQLILAQLIKGNEKQKKSFENIFIYCFQKKFLIHFDALKFKPQTETMEENQL
jgi:hypothetical protein